MSVVDTWREAERNAVLRRADWRFLLPNPHPERIICFAGGSLQRAVSHVGSVVMRDCWTPSTYNLAVATNPDRDELEQAWSALQPGGACYVEWTRPVMGGSSGVRRKLEQAGFTNVSCYWAWPLPQRAPAQFWLPLASPAALDYFLSHRPRSSSIRSTVRRTVQRFVWHIVRSMGLIAPLFVIAQKPSDKTYECEQRGWLSDLVRNNWQQWGFERPPQHLTSLLLTGGMRSINKVVTMVFADNERMPRLIVKQPRVPESIQMLAHEAETLQAVHSLRTDGIPGVPRVRFWQQNEVTVALGETVLDGQPIFVLLRPDNYQHLALQATEWLVKLVDTGTLQPREVWWKRIVEPALSDFERSFGAVIDSTLLYKTRTILATLGELPLTCEQRDFSPWNVLVADDGSLIVLDWESAEVRGLPALDLIYFLTYLAFFLDGAMESKQFQQSYHAMLDPTTFTGRVVADCQNYYLKHTGIVPEILHALRLLVWIIHARSEYRQLTAEAGAVPEPERLQRSLFFNLWNIEAGRIACINTTV